MKAKKEDILNFKSQVMNKRLLFFCVFFILSYSSFSQEYDPYTYQEIKKEPILSEKVFFGGGFGLQFGNSLVLKLTPEIGYKIFPTLEAGVGAYYLYAKSFSYNYTDNVYGGKIFSRLFIYNNIFIQGEYEMLNIADFNLATNNFTGERVFVPGLLGGIGYRQKIGKRGAVLSSIFYNFTITEKTPYSNPLIRFTIIF